MATRKTATKKTVEGAVRPTHYKDYIPGMQWIDAIQNRYSSREFIAAVDMQVDKYLARKGKKDEDIQELKKSLWYLRYLVAFQENHLEHVTSTEVDTILDIKRGHHINRLDLSLLGEHLWIEAVQYLYAPAEVIIIFDARIREHMNRAMRSQDTLGEHIQAMLWLTGLIAFMEKGLKPLSADQMFYQ